MTAQRARPPKQTQKTVAVPADPERRVLPSTLAGCWYPAEVGALRDCIAALQPVPPPPPVRELCAALVPHAGYAYSGAVSAQVLARIDPAAFDRVVVIAPSHYLPLRDRVSVPDATHMATPLGEVSLDTAFLAEVQKLPGVVNDARAHDREHSTQIQAPLLQMRFGERLRLAPLVVGQMRPGAALMFSKHLRPLLDNRTLVLVSSDFTHFGPHFEYVPRFEDVPRGIEALDRRVFDRFAAGDLDGFWQVLEETGATVCGRVAIAVLMGMLPRAATVEEIAYETSGRLLGDWENSVSYFGALVHGAWTPLKRAPAGAAGESDETELLSSADRGLLLRLARATLEQVVRSGQLPPLEETGVTLTPGLERVRGGFVTLHVDGELRGCIGEIFARRPIWEVVREQTANAACNDPRFMAVTPRETSAIRIEISVLSPTRPVASFRDIVIGRHGMVMHKSGRSAVFLPQVAEEQGWDLETTLSYLARKAGLHADAWREGADFQVFEADVFNE